MTAPLVRRVLGAALDLAYPARCVGCASFGALLCDRCRVALVPATGPGRCPNCSASWTEPLNCPRCQSWDGLDGCVAAFEMAGVARQLVHALKYEYVTAAAPLMAAEVERFRDGPRPFDVAVAVPLHPSRQRRRGFNQAGRILDQLGWPGLPGRMVRGRRTHQQVGLGHRDRRANVAGAFDYSGGRLEGMVVGLVDDVVTTGATANECARVLKDHGARGVVSVAFARASFDLLRPDAPIVD